MNTENVLMVVSFLSLTACVALFFYGVATGGFDLEEDEVVVMTPFVHVVKVD